MEDDEQPNRIEECNEKMVGKRVFVCSGSGFYAYVIDVIGGSHFKVKQDNNKEMVVSIFDIRSLS